MLRFPMFGNLALSYLFPNINLLAFEFIIKNAAIIGAIVVIITFIISLNISVSIYNKKEL